MTGAVAALDPASRMTAPACAALGVSRATVHWRRAGLAASALTVPPPPKPRPRPARGLTDAQRQTVLDLLHEPRFADQAPAEIYAALLDEGIYHCSIRTIYRILGANAEVRERRNQRRHPVYTKPELLAEGPNQVWSWDITKLKGPAKWSYFYLYVILDIFSRRVVGWCLADAENASLFKTLFDDTIAKYDIPQGQLTLHADRGGPMTAKSTALMLADLGVTRSHSRPHTSNDNPFPEIRFKTMKYQPKFPRNFGCIEDAKVFCRTFFDWYNQEHHHTGIGLLTPDQVHYGQADALYAARQETLDRAAHSYPERLVKPHPTNQPRSGSMSQLPRAERRRRGGFGLPRAAIASLRFCPALPTRHGPAESARFHAKLASARPRPRRRVQAEPPLSIAGGVVLVHPIAPGGG